MKYAFGIIIFFIALFVYTKFAGPIPFYVNSIQTTKSDVFQVDGTGQVSAAPDMATISFGVTKNAATIADAQNQTNRNIQKILDSLKNLGIESKDIKTTNYSMNPSYASDGQTITGYSVTQNVDIKITSLENVTKTLDALTAHGANLIGQVRFGFSDSLEQKLETQARQEAVQQAKEKAQSLASAAGIHLGQIINVTENPATSGGPVPLFQAAGKVADSTAPTQVTPGENSISTTITLSYQTY